MKYDIQSVETIYNGTYFRSRLEATWAVFFERCKWSWEYEPMDLNGWFPDFAIKNNFGDKKDILVEVKPYDLSIVDIGNINDEIKKDLEKISLALGHGKEMLFLGRCPYKTRESHWYEHMCLGLLVRSCEFGIYEVDHAVMNFLPNRGFDVCDELCSYTMRMSGEYDGNQWPAPANTVNIYWGLAKKITQHRHCKKQHGGRR